MPFTGATGSCPVEPVGMLMASVFVLRSRDEFGDDEPIPTLPSYWNVAIGVGVKEVPPVEDAVPGPLLVTACGVHKSGSCRQAVFVDQSAQAISTDDVA